MNISDSLDQNADICRDAIKNTSAKLNKSFENLLIEILLLYMVIPRKINFTQMERYGSHCEQTYRSNFNRKRSECINWLLFNLSMAKRSLDMAGHLAIAINPCYISKAGKKTAHIGTFGFHLVSRFRDNADLRYLYTGPKLAREDLLNLLMGRSTMRNSTTLAWRNSTLRDWKARHTRQLDFSYNASFSALNVAKVMMKENEQPNSMASFKSLKFNSYYTKRFFDMSRIRPNQTLISKIVKELIGWQRKAV